MEEDLLEFWKQIALDSRENVSYAENVSLYIDYDYPSLELPPESHITLITLYTLTTTLALIGNVSVIIVLVFGHRSKTEIRKYLLNLAISDICMATFCIPFSFTKTMLGRWVFGEAMCPTVLFMQITSVGVSIFTNTAIGCDRYMAVIHPIQSRMTKSRPGVIICCIWIGAIILACPQIFVSRTRERFYDGEVLVECGERWTARSRSIYTITILTVTYLVPLLLLIFSYHKICYALWKTFEYGIDDAVHRGIRDKVRLHSRRKIVKMLITLVVVFALCWFPLNLLNLVLDLDPSLLDLIQTREDERLLIGLYYSCHWLAMASCFANPIIYSFLNESFRADGLNLVRRCCPVRGSLKFVSSMRTSSLRRLLSKEGRAKSGPPNLASNKSKKNASNDCKKFVEDEINDEKPLPHSTVQKCDSVRYVNAMCNEKADIDGALRGAVPDENQR